MDNRTAREASSMRSAIEQARARKSIKGNNHVPPKCTCCDREIESITACVDHLSSARHVKKVGGLCGCKDNQCAERDSIIVSMLTCPTQRQLHVDYGFKVEEILTAIADGTSQPRYDGAKELALLIPPDRNWFVEVSRYHVAWDGSKSEGDSFLPPTKAATIEQSLHRISVDQLPPKFTSPTLPIRLPVVERSSTKLLWPYRPGIVLPFALMKSKGQSLDDIDVIASTSLLYALSGQVSDTIKDSFLLQMVGTTIAIVHMRENMTNHSFGIGTLVETICCPPETPSSSSYSISRVEIGDRTFLFYTEVDGYDIEASATVEVKARRKTNPDIKGLIQIMTNGSSKIVNFKASKDGLSLESSVVHTREEIMNLHQSNWIYIGQRIRYLLPMVFDNPKVRNAVDTPVVMTFDKARLPQFSPAPSGYSVIPPDYHT